MHQEPSAPTPPRPWLPRFSSPLARLLLLSLLLLALQVPLGMIHGVVQERAARRDEAVGDILGKWGGRQSLAGPILYVPFVTRRSVPDGHGQLVEQVTADAAYLLPQTLHIQGRLQAQERHRGIFEVPVYGAELQLSGQFGRPDFSVWGVRPEDVDWRHAELLLGLAEPRTLRADAALDWNGHAVRFNPSVGQNGWNVPGIHVPLGQDLAQVFEGDGSSFAVKLGFNGADGIAFAPTAEDTEVELQSGWPHPSFQGGWLPVQYQAGAEGFSARWSVSYLGRDYPQRWRESANAFAALAKSQFGVALAEPVDTYVMAERVIKYAVLTLLFTFAVIWLTEVLSGQAVHPIQYGFVGAALCLFGLLQLSFAEHFGFTPAFVAAAAAVVVLVTLYSRSLLRRTWQALTVGAVLGGLYAYLYAILRAEDHALLGGSVALFAGLAAAMYLTRRVDWGALGRRPLDSAIR
jgi:inner membrane protein